MAWLRSSIKLIIFVAAAIAAILFAIANRAPVAVSFDPISREAPMFATSLPLYLVVMAAIGVGVLLGGAGAWLAQGRHRKAERRLRRETQALRADAERARASQGGRPSLPAA